MHSSSPQSALNRFQLLITFGYVVVAIMAIPQLLDAKTYPPQMPLLDVTAPPYSADSSGMIDATAGIQQAMIDAREAAKTGIRQPVIVYFPNGTYKVSGKMSLGSNTVQRVILEGESRDGVTIRLIDNAPGFQAVGNSTGFDSQLRPVISFFEGNSDNNSFWNSIADMTIDIGSGNPGAIGLEFHNNNVGSIRNVTVRSSDPSHAGAIGIKIHRGLAGIGYMKDVLVDGFEYGVWLHTWKIGYVMEHVTLRNQRRYGIRNGQKLLSVRKLTSENSVPAIYNEQPEGMVVILESDFQNGDPTQPAIVNQGYFYGRHLEVDGYASAIDDRGTAVDGPVLEYVSHPVITLFPDTPETATGLDVEETPEVPWDDTTSYAIITAQTQVPLNPAPAWAVVDGSAQSVDTQAIQNAIDSGATSVLLPTADYTINDTIILRGNVRRFHGGYSGVVFANNFQMKGLPVFKIETGDHPVLTMEALAPEWVGGSDYDWIRNESAADLVIKDTFLGWGTQYYTNAPGVGTLYMENVASGGAGLVSNNTAWEFTEQKVFIRHFDPEKDFPHIVNDGGQLWMLGAKVGEERGPFLVTKNQGVTEALGVFFNSLDKDPLPEGEERALIINDESEVTVVGFEDTTVDGGVEHSHTIIETRNGVTEKALHAEAPKRAVQFAHAAVFPLYRGGGEGGVLTMAMFQNDVGETGRAGEVTTGENGGINTKGAGKGLPLGSASDEHYFIYEPSATTGGISATVEHIWNLNGEASLAGLIIRDDLRPQSRFVSLTINGAHQLIYRYRPFTGGPVKQAGSPVTINLPVHLSFTRDAQDNYRAYYDDGVGWQLFGRKTQGLGDTVIAGIATASGTHGILWRADFTNYESSMIASNTQTASFQQGVNGYGQCLDTYIRDGYNVDFSDLDRLEVATNSTRHGLIKFGDIVGPEEGQIPPNATILSATIELQTINGGGTLKIHRLLQDWENDVNWVTSFGGDGIQPNGVEAETASLVVKPLTNTRFDVSAAVQSWANGEPNHGLALLKEGSFASIPSSESAQTSARPKLQVIFAP